MEQKLINALNISSEVWRQSLNTCLQPTIKTQALVIVNNKDTNLPGIIYLFKVNNSNIVDFEEVNVDLVQCLTKLQYGLVLMIENFNGNFSLFLANFQFNIP